jgi:KDO2-lipid IV(A) lauroyltransferase
MRYYIFCFIRFLVLILPRRVSYLGARFIAVFYHILARKDRIALNFNFDPFIDKKERKGIIKKVFLNFSYYIVDFFRYDKVSTEFIEKYVEVKGRENLDDALRLGKGVVLLTAHLGNYELGAVTAALLGYDIYAVALPHSDRRTNQLFNKQRNKMGVKVISTGAGMRGCFDVFKENGVLGFLGDRAFSGKTVDVKMLGRTARLPRGFVSLSLHTEAVIVPAFFIRSGDKYRYEFILEKPIVTTGYSPTDAAQAYADVLVKFIVKYPEQWYMFAKFWSECE